jgi:outer membrane protein OmpA-like peptidoglycan-associated protein
MRTRLLMLLSCVVALLCATSPLMADERAGALPVSPYFGGYTFDDEHQLNTRPLYGLRLGCDVNDDIGVEGVFNYASTRLPGHASAPNQEPSPAPPPAPKPESLPEKVCITLNIEFDFNRADVKPKYHGVIGKVANFMKQYPKTTAVIEGYTDNRGTYQYNIKLSERRAESVRTYLIEKYSIEADRLTTKGYGFTKPKDSNKTAEGRQNNRRIEAMIDCIVYAEK